MIELNDSALRDELIEYLSEYVTEVRRERLQEVLQNRTRHITVVLEDLYQTQNISAVMRTCDCYGIQDAYIVENRNEFEVHKDISMGADKWLTLHQYPHAEHNMKQCIDDLHAKGYTVVATLPDEKKTTIHDLPIEQKTAFLFGTELCRRDRFFFSHGSVPCGSSWTSQKVLTFPTLPPSFYPTFQKDSDIPTYNGS